MERGEILGKTNIDKMEEKENRLTTYMLKIRNMADYLARGYIIEQSDEETSIEIVADDTTMRRNAFSVTEYSYYDILDQRYYGEQRSFGILIDLINNGEYERQVECNVDFSEKFVPDPEEDMFYIKVMKRVERITKLMFWALIHGLHIPVDSQQLYYLQVISQEDDERDDEIEPFSGYIKYDIKTDTFLVVNEDDEIILEDICIEDVMPIYNDWLEEKEQEELKRQAIRDVQKRRKELEEQDGSNIGEDGEIEL